MENYIIIKLDKETGRSEMEVVKGTAFEALGLLRFWEKQKYIAMNGYFKDGNKIKNEFTDCLKWFSELNLKQRKELVHKHMNREYPDFKPDKIDLLLIYKIEVANKKATN